MNKDKIAVIYSDRYTFNNVDLMKHHPLKSDRFEYIYSSLAGMEGIDPYRPKGVLEEDLRLIHTDKYLRDLNYSIKIAEYFEYESKLITREIADQIIQFSWAMTGGTVLATSLIEKYNVVINLGGGFHHAKPDKGEGFCLCNDIAIAAKKLRPRYKKILVVDLDVHQGNGTIACLKDDKDVFTFSMHDKNIYPFPKEVGSYDIELNEGEKDESYLLSLKHALRSIIRNDCPDIVLYVAGCDVLEEDNLSTISMTPQGVIERDQYVVQFFTQWDIPVIMTLSGGYSKNAAETQADSIRNIVKGNTCKT